MGVGACGLGVMVGGGVRRDGLRHELHLRVAVGVAARQLRVRGREPEELVGVPVGANVGVPVGAAVGRPVAVLAGAVAGEPAGAGCVSCTCQETR